MLRLLVLLLIFVAPACLAARPCFAPEQAEDHVGKDICLSAHVYGVQEGPDGTRYLDVCGDDTPTCRFVVVSLPRDRRDVGSLADVSLTDVHLRGTVRQVGDESFLLLSNKRQFHDGAERFTVNPDLLRGFGVSTPGYAYRDPSRKMYKHQGVSSFVGSSAAR